MKTDFPKLEMASAPSGSASYKKKDGTLTVSKDHKSISWIPAAGGAGGAVTVAVKNMTSTYILYTHSKFSYLTELIVFLYRSTANACK